MQFAFFHCGHLENHPKWRVGPKILSVNILILNQGGPMNNIIPLPEGPKGVHGDPSGPIDYGVSVNVSMISVLGKI